MTKPTIRKRPILSPKLVESNKSDINPEKKPIQMPYVLPKEKATKKTKMRTKFGAISLMEIIGAKLICNATNMIIKRITRNTLIVKLVINLFVISY
ncbi:unnamed protein product [marine sediment metagenome]|uniref:Uncharacterized protein n=1 Tax=marine sediment metagenome TaxID=412755 RepID=X1UVR4_9ZZZZ